MTKYAGMLAIVGLRTTIGCADAADVQTESGNPGTVVNVRLTDTNHSMDLNKTLGLGIGMKGDMATATMKIEIHKCAVPVGLVTFKVTKATTDMKHE